MEVGTVAVWVRVCRVDRYVILWIIDRFFEFCFFFFFQAEDGIRDYKVTGVQTCALPIWLVVSV